MYEGFKLSGRLEWEALGIRRKEYYKTGDVCKLLEISFSTYKNWERQGWFPEAKRNDISGFRIFDEKDLAELQRLFKARARRFKGKGGAQ